MALIKFENPETQRAFEEIARTVPGDELEVIRRWRLFGERAIRGDLASLAKLVRQNEEFLRSRPGRFAILPESDEERAGLETSYRNFGETWQMEE